MPLRTKLWQTRLLPLLGVDVHNTDGEIVGASKLPSHVQLSLI